MITLYNVLELVDGCLIKIRKEGEAVNDDSEKGVFDWDQKSEILAAYGADKTVKTICPYFFAGEMEGIAIILENK